METKMTDTPKSPLNTVVETTDLGTGVLENRRVIDHNDRESRQWLGRHCYWAMRNGRKVTTYPATDAASAA